MSILNGASHIAILGGTQVTTGAGSSLTINQTGHIGVSTAFKELSSSIASTALHDSAARFDSPRCHRNTRTKYLDQLELWMLGTGREYDGKRLIWLHGGAGAGKSAIMQSTVERCARHAVILGSFFFSRSDSTRNYAETLIPTLAFQVARTFHAAMDILGPIIDRNPLIFQASLQTQTYELLVRPLLYLIETGVIKHTNQFCGVFVIDGLDECSDPDKQVLIIQMITSIICDYHVPIGFLVASRPDVAISTAFQREDRLHGIFASISLERDIEAESDIRRFIEDGFLDIVNHHPLRHHIIMPWPSPLSIAKLVWKSSGHFIYAATAMKFIMSPNEFPARALRVVEGLEPSRTESPFAQLDALYSHILTSAKYSSNVIGILRHCYLTAFSHSVGAICSIYDISPADIELFLFDVQALVFLTHISNNGMHVMARHASLEDFFQDPKRAQSLYMAGEYYHASLLKRYFQLLDNSSQSPAPATALHVWPGQEYRLIQALATAIKYSQDSDLLRRLINDHSPQDIWDFCRKFLESDTGVLSGIRRELITRSVCEYMCAIRDSWLQKVNHDNGLYIPQFRMYIQLMLDDLGKFVHKEPQYRVVPALIFSSNPAGLVLAYNLLRYFRRQFRIGTSYRDHFEYLQGSTDGVIDLRSYEAIRCLPQSRLAWGADLAFMMKLVLRQLVDFSATLGIYSGSHRQWLRRNKPWKQTALGSPKLASGKMSRVCVWSSTRLNRTPEKMTIREKKCVILLRAVVHYLHKSDCTSDVVKLAQRSLPKAAMRFPALMKRARADMEDYTSRWEGSLEGLLAAAQSLSVNDLD